MGIRVWVWVCGLLCGIPSAGSQTCCSGGVPLANNLGGLPLTEKGSFQFSLAGDMNRLLTLKEGTVVLDDKSRERTTFSTLFKASYTLTNRVSLETLMSWVSQQRIISQAGGFSNKEQTRGFGDLAVLVNYSYYKRKRIVLTAGIGPKLPTGPSDLANVNGLPLNADLQPGSGAWDALWLHRIQVTSKKRPSRIYFTNITYRYTGINPEYLNQLRYRFGNEFQLIAGVADQVVIGKSLFTVGVNARFRHASQDALDDERLPNTGGTWIFMMPNVGWHIQSNMILSVNGELPLYAKIKGTQLSPTFRINGGLYYAFQRKNKSL